LNARVDAFRTPAVTMHDSVVVGIAADADAPAWSRYVLAHPSGTVFHHWAWRAILSDTFAHRPHYLIARRGTDVVGVLPLAQVRTLLFGHSLVSLPFCSWAGPLVSDAAAARALDAHAVGLAESLGVSNMAYRQIGPSERGWPSQDLYVMFAKTIDADHEANMAAIPRKQRAMVRKGIKHGLVGTLASVDAFHDLYADNVHRHGTPGVPKRFFARIQEAFGDDCDMLIVRSAEGAPLSGVLNLYWRDEVFPFYAGDRPEARALAANDFKYWEVMRRGADRGCRRFNYGRSKRGTGSFDFKTNWGFEPTPLTYDYWLREGGVVPENNPLNPKFRLMIETWRRLPRALVDAIGPRVVRGLG
jgi:FemAB-related protein (PEP-CTERM system-associated)